MPTTIESGWADFEQTLIPAHTKESERRWLRTAFFTGAVSGLGVLTEIANSPGISPAETIRIINARLDEIEEFSDALARQH